MQAAHDMWRSTNRWGDGFLEPSKVKYVFRDLGGSMTIEVLRVGPSPSLTGGGLFVRGPFKTVERYRPPFSLLRPKRRILMNIAERRLADLRRRGVAMTDLAGAT